MLGFLKEYRRKKEQARWVELVRKSAGAAVLISLGNFALLKLGNPIGPVIL